MIDDIAIRYNQKQARLGLVFGIFFLVLGILSIALRSHNLLFPFGMGIVYVVMYFYKKRVLYVYTKDGYLKKDFGKKIPIDDIFAGDYIFKSKHATITVDKNVVDKSSVEQMENFINAIRAKSSR